MKTTNNLIYKESKYNEDKTEKINVEIRLNDECKNGHEDFAITCTGYEKYNGRWQESYGGSAHEQILKFFPEFQIFVDLHLSDAKGAHMYTTANGFYHLSRMEEQQFCEYFRCNKRQYKELKIAESETHFTLIIEYLQLPKQWLKQANQAIKQLEKLTKKKFKSAAVKSNFKSLDPGVKEDLKQKLDDGYFSTENLAERKQAKKDKSKKDLKDSIKAQYKKQTDELRVKANIDLYFVNNDIKIDNMIYYSHTNTICFNWQTSEYYSQMTEKQFDDLCNTITLDHLPEGVKLQLGKDKAFKTAKVFKINS